MRWIDDEKLRALTLAGRVDASANHAKWKEREVSNIEFIAGAAIRKDAGRQGPHTPVGSTPAPFIPLPWPPTGNTAVRHANGAHYLRPEVTAYRQTIAAQLGRSEPVGSPYALEVELSPPDRRTRDIDNVLKSLLDALVKAGWLPGDSMAHMRRLAVTVREDYTGTVYVRALTDREAA